MIMIIAIIYFFLSYVIFDQQLKKKSTPPFLLTLSLKIQTVQVPSYLPKLNIFQGPLQPICGTSPQPSKLFIRFMRLIALANIYQLSKFGDLMSCVHPVSCTNTHHDVTDLVNHGMVKNTKTLIS